MTLKFVNHVGQSVSIERLAAAPPGKKSAKASLKRTTDAAKATHHFGFEVVGVRKSAMEAARTHHELRQKASPANGWKAFDAQAWLLKQASKRVVPRVFVIESAAQQAAQILDRSGDFLRLHVQPILKG